MNFRIGIIVLIAVLCHLSCFSQQKEDEIAIITKIAKRSKNHFIYPKTISLGSEFGDLSHLENVESWNDGNNDVSNFAIGRTVDFDTIFSKENLKSIVREVKSCEKVKLRKIVSKSLLKRSADIAISNPVFVNGINNILYAIIYTEYSGVSGDGSGRFTIYQKKGDEWVEFFWLSLWIS
ncbi:hypothetical protein [Flagellimonas onchidii]|uniref:hypothetical protein n=1 Tax=Flagellimonas onchidii TaxID=2562684 RepID=UPI0010A67150|nr:hypothetical protein [Allomuricauda onchidii]